ncbi:MAG: M23 family metallopeptidase, partial [Syntrophomonadaceae bacterium]|nr:M23 family metallopeptidase [Syntrophomonadaceae bacterium]
VKENSMVKPVLPGQIIEIKGNISDRKIVIKHNGDFSSEYDGLSEVLVSEKDWVKHNTVLGKTGSRLYFQVKNQDGPLNPNDIFK